MNPLYIEAIEKRLEWLAWANGPGAGLWQSVGYGGWKMSSFHRSLTEGETFYMDPHFCRLVDHARRTVPDDMVYDPSWLVRPAGWMWIGEPFLVPRINFLNTATAEKLAKMPNFKPVVAAVGWHAVEPGSKVGIAGDGGNLEEGATYIAPEGCTHFQFFMDFGALAGKPGFGAWSFFVLQPGQRLGDRIQGFEHMRQSAQGNYDPAHPELHEIRWLYAALFLTSQRLAMRVRHDTDRHTRRRAEKKHMVAPPFLDVVTLRRLEAARPRTESEAREWNWQWEVRGHWRNQWYPAERVHRQKFIEAYVKGDPDKPFKEHGTKLFVASR